MTTLTLRVNLYDKTITPALGSEPESIAVGETVKLRLLGLGLSAAEVNVRFASDEATPALRVRVRHDGMGDIAIFPFPGAEDGWTEETVEGETALCCDLDLGTAQAYALFGGIALPDGATRRVRVVVERSFPNENPTLYASDRLTLGSWSFPRHALRVIAEPTRTELTNADVERALSAATSGFQAEVSGVVAQMEDRALAIAAAMSGVTEETISGLREVLDVVTEEAVTALVSGAVQNAPFVHTTGDENVYGNKTFSCGLVTFGNVSVSGSLAFGSGSGVGTLRGSSSGEVVVNSGAVPENVGWNYLPEFYYGRKDNTKRFVTVDMLERVIEPMGYGQTGIGDPNNYRGVLTNESGLLEGLTQIFSGLSVVTSGISGISVVSGLYPGSSITSQELILAITNSLIMVTNYLANNSSGAITEDNLCDKISNCPSYLELSSGFDEVKSALSGISELLYPTEPGDLSIPARVAQLEEAVRNLTPPTPPTPPPGPDPEPDDPTDPDVPPPEEPSDDIPDPIA